MVESLHSILAICQFLSITTVHQKQKCLTGKLSSGVEFNAPASTVHEFFCSKLPLMASVCPGKVKSVDLLQGEWGKPGSVVLWRYTLDGKNELTGKWVMEEIDYANNKITSKLVEGPLLDQYKSVHYVFQATPKGQDSCVATSTLKYEKPNAKVAEPTAALDFCVSVGKAVAANLVAKPQA